MSARAAFEALKQAGLEPLLQAARQKLYEQDGIRGRVAVALGPSEREELANLLGRPLRGGGPASVNLPELDAALGRSRFRAGLDAVLEAGYGPLTTRRQERDEASARWQAWLEGIRSSLPGDPAVSAWFEALSAGASPCGRWVRRAYGADPDRAAGAATAVARALAALPARSERYELLAVFAAAITGDPHAFDAAEPAGALLEHALAEQFGPPEAGLRASEARALLLDRAGLGVDQVSSTVLVAHLASARAGGNPHPVAAAMAEYGGAWALTMGEVRGWEAASARNGRAYVVENPPVFEWLLRRLAIQPSEQRPTLICTGGFLSAAGVRLLDLLAASGAELWYGGDFDRNGLAIASWLANRYTRAFRAWRMAPGDYREAVPEAGHPVADQDRDYLAGMEGPLAATARAMAEVGRAAYQERLVEQLLLDIAPVG